MVSDGFADRSNGVYRRSPVTGTGTAIHRRPMPVQEPGGAARARGPWYASRAGGSAPACISGPGLRGRGDGVLSGSRDATGREFERLESEAARNFAHAARAAGVRRIVFLGGLAHGSDLSPHMRSRLETGNILRESGIPVIEFRASIVIGSGSASFELIRALVERLPVMVTPRWVHTVAQPIGIDDVIAYLVEAIGVEDGKTHSSSKSAEPTLLLISGSCGNMRGSGNCAAGFSRSQFSAQGYRAAG